MHFTLVCPTQTEFWDAAPANEGFDRAEVVRILDELEQQGHDYRGSPGHGNNLRTAGRTEP